MKRVQEGQAEGEVVTGLLYVDPTPKDLHHHLNTVDAPLNDDIGLLLGSRRQGCKRQQERQKRCDDFHARVLHVTSLVS